MTRHPHLTPLRLVATIALPVGLLLAPMRATANDVVMEWNQIALAATAAQGPVRRSIMAIVHVSGTSGERHQLRPTGPNLPWLRPWATADAAAIGAAYRALVACFLPRRRRSAWRATPRSPRTD